MWWQRARPFWSNDPLALLRVIFPGQQCHYLDTQNTWDGNGANTHQVLPDNHGNGQDKPHCDRDCETAESRKPNLVASVIGGALQCMEGDIIARDGNQKGQPPRVRYQHLCWHGGN